MVSVVVLVVVLVRLFFFRIVVMPAYMHGKSNWFSKLFGKIEKAALHTIDLKDLVALLQLAPILETKRIVVPRLRQTSDDTANRYHVAPVCCDKANVITFPTPVKLYGEF